MNWNPYKQQVINLYLADPQRSSGEIAGILQQSFPKVNWPQATDRRVREIITAYKDAIGEPVENHGAKILVYDIETSPAIAYIFSLWQKGIPDNMIAQDVGMFSWAAKWLFEDEIISDRLTPEELATMDYSRITHSLYNLIEEADIIIAHNGMKFDRRMMNTFFLKCGLTPNSPYEVIDTLLHARKQFKLTSYRLDYIAQQVLGLPGKLHTELGLWKRCMQGEYEALVYMDEYCQQDVRVLEDVYLKLRPWIKPHPNAALTALSDDNCCPVCAGVRRTVTRTTYKTYVNEYIAYRCDDCGHIYRSRKSLTPIHTHPTFNVSLPK